MIAQLLLKPAYSKLLYDWNMTLKEKYPNTNMAIPHPAEKQASDRIKCLFNEPTVLIKVDVNSISSAVKPNDKHTLDTVTPGLAVSSKVLLRFRLRTSTRFPCSSDMPISASNKFTGIAAIDDHLIAQAGKKFPRFLFTILAHETSLCFLSSRHLTHKQTENAKFMFQTYQLHQSIPDASIAFSAIKTQVTLPNAIGTNKADRTQDADAGIKHTVLILLDLITAVTHLQTLQSTMQWRHVEFEAEMLMDAYSGLLSDQSIILAMNSSFVDPLLQFESQMRILELSFRKIFSLPDLSTVQAMGRNSEDTEVLESQLEHFPRGKVEFDNSLKFFKPSELSQTPTGDACLLVAELSLLCSHKNPSIEQQAATGMNYVLYIGMCQNPNIVKQKTGSPSIVETDNTRAIASDFNLLPKNIQGDRDKIAQSVGQILLPTFLTDFVWTLLKKLSSPDDETALEAASLLILTLEYHAQKITMVSKIVDDIYEQLSWNSSHTMKNVLLRVISLLIRASPKKVIFQLMEFPVPADEALLLMWKAASTEPSVAPQVLKTILSILKGKPGEFEEVLIEKRRFSLNATNLMPVAASQALCTFLPVNSYRKVVIKLFPEFLMALMLQLFYCNQLLKDTAQGRSLYVRDGLKVLLNCSGLKEVHDALEKKNFWDQFSQVMDHQYGIQVITKTLSECNFPQFPETLHYVYKIAVEGPRRSEDSIVTIIFFAETAVPTEVHDFTESIKEFNPIFRANNPGLSELTKDNLGRKSSVLDSDLDSKNGSKMRKKSKDVTEKEKDTKGLNKKRKLYEDRALTSESLSKVECEELQAKRKKSGEDSERTDKDTAKKRRQRKDSKKKKKKPASFSSDSSQHQQDQGPLQGAMLKEL
ncbi:hypothetical protein U0070_005536 [Myodes glareolus]|uniref:Maestro-like HEAT-repeats domain-containing protein n=1 Tax=Myodes glareolus TaxID=447135 RepID=A0AAW0IU68_MYOGA